MRAMSPFGQGDACGMRRNPVAASRARIRSGATGNASVLSPHATDDPADAKGNDGGRVGSLFDDLANVIISIRRALTHDGGGIGSRIFRLAIKVLRRPCSLLDESLGLALGVPGHAAKTFLGFAGEIPGRASDTIFIHGKTSCVAPLTETGRN